MPGLVACRRRWEIGSDDLMFPAFGELWVRIAWMVGISVVFSLHKDQLTPDQGCHGGYLLKYYYIGILAILSCHLLLDFIIMLVATRGTIVNPHARRHMSGLVYVKLFLYVPELGWTIFGTYWAFHSGTADGCDAAVIWTVRGAAVVGWLGLLGLLVGLLLVFDPMGSRTGTSLDDPAAASRVWETRCRLLCFCAACDEQSNSAFRDVARLLTDYFQGVDLVATDIASGMLLIYMDQQKSPVLYNLQSMPFSGVDNPTLLPDSPGDVQPGAINNGDHHLAISGQMHAAPQETVPVPKPWMNVHTAAHYMKFALSNYGWPMYMYMNMMSGMCKLMPHCQCCLCSKPDVEVLNDNACHCHTAAILQVTGIQPHDIIYASFHNRIYEIPFYVAMDHQNKSVIVSIRGTLSLRDALVDLTADCEELPMEGCTGGKCHKGIYLAASFIRSTLNNLQILEKAFTSAPSYGLVITGHSLGAGAATILAMLLRPQFPSLQCYAFSPPGGLLSHELRRLTEEFVLSVIVGKDLVPRLSITNMEKFKVQILNTLKDCTLAKESLEEAIRNSERNQAAIVPLYPPGQILFLDEEEPATSCMDTPQYVAAWANPAMFDDILVSPKMVADHLPDVVLKALEQLVERGTHSPTRSIHKQTGL